MGPLEGAEAMTPQRHPPTSVRARMGYVCVWYDDSTSCDVHPEAFEPILHALEAARRATRCFLPESQIEGTPLTLTVRGLFGDRHAIDLLRAQHISCFGPEALRLAADDAALYEPEDSEREPWQG